MQFDILDHNVKVYDFNNVELYMDDYTKNINKYKANIVIIDPPWGGIEYKQQENLNLKLGEYSMDELVNNIDADLIMLKLPMNHRLDIFPAQMKKYRICNYLIVVIPSSKLNKNPAIARYKAIKYEHKIKKLIRKMTRTTDSCDN